MQPNPQYARWRFVLPGNKYLYRSRNSDAVRIWVQFTDWRAHQQDPFDVYVVGWHTNQWNFVTHWEYTETCQCGRSYEFSQNGVEFRKQRNMLLPGKTIAQVITFMQNPFLCQICYYEQEFKAGYFCPKWVKQQLGIEE